MVPETTKKKICLIGDFGVGKTSLIRRFIDGRFSENYLSTVGVQVSQKDVEINDDGNHLHIIRLMIWDLEGRTKFQAISEKYLEGSHGAILVADINRQDSIMHLHEHLALISSLKTQGVKVVVAFNKGDLVKETTTKDLLSGGWFQTQEQVLSAYLTSAKTGQNVEILFERLARSFLA